jgi:hypothetical protein|tara:strand:- start:166 stop:381 length:216 start_codon:yes stop_codon:yes gene_type:complete
MKLNKTISLEHIITIAVLVGSMTMAFGFMKADISNIEKLVDLKADREIIEYKLDIIHKELMNVKEMIKEKK